MFMLNWQNPLAAIEIVSLAYVEQKRKQHDIITVTKSAEQGGQLDGWV